MDQEVASEGIQRILTQVVSLSREVARLNTQNRALAIHVDVMRISQQINNNQANLGLEWLQSLYLRIDELLPLPAAFPGVARPGLHDEFAQNDVLSEQIAQLGRHQRMSSMTIAATQTQLRAISSQLHVIQSQMEPNHQQRTEVSRPSPAIRSSPEPDLPELQVPAVTRDPLGDNSEFDRRIKSEPDLTRDPSPLPEFESYSNSRQAPPLIQDPLGDNSDSEPSIKLEPGVSRSPSPWLEEWALGVGLEADPSGHLSPLLEPEPYPHSNPRSSSEPEWDSASIRLPSPSPEPESPYQHTKRSSQSPETDWSELTPTTPAASSSPPPSLASSRKRKSSSGTVCSSPRASKSRRFGTPTLSEIDWLSDSGHNTDGEMDSNADIEESDWIPASSPPTFSELEWMHHTPSSSSSSLGSESFIDYNRSPSPEPDLGPRSSPPASSELECMHHTPMTPSGRSSSLGTESYIDYNHTPLPEPEYDPNSSRSASLGTESLYQLVDTSLQSTEGEWQEWTPTPEED
ncbi:hypothetical protein BZA77DRAFT_295609 [Pyronema omphalodes]|nr:hypothetical protein BZA77DRAFT_295609 [Pyronema omphalodes]